MEAMNSLNTVTQTIQKLVTEHFFIRSDFFKLNRTFKGDFGFNSLEMTELVVMIEQQLGIIIPDESLHTIRNVNDLVYVTHQSFIPERN